MNVPYIEAVQTQSDWQVVFAFQAFLRPIDQWIKMKWGFNTAVLLEEALDRFKLFLESQVTSDEFQSEDEQSNRTLALRCINLPGEGLQFAILGKAADPEKEHALTAGRVYAREIFSTFPHDFILKPAETKPDFDRLAGSVPFTQKIRLAGIQRENAFFPPMLRYQYITGLWQSSSRAYEQVWRALSGSPPGTMLNITLRPSTLYQNEKELLLDVRKKLPKPGQDEDIFSPHLSWVDACIKRRLTPWKKFFQMQIHVLAEDAPDDNLLRSIGSAFTRSTSDLSTPGFQIVRPNSADEEEEWRRTIRTLDFTPSPRRMDDLADVDEVHAVFRLPYRQETGLPGLSLVELPKESSPSAEQKENG
ncbi:MAG: hypothetical protein HND47_22185 [Chloroflexi bacterium]|nr:hypothetical protein [Chloroflexota bacterium]